MGVRQWIMWGICHGYLLCWVHSPLGRVSTPTKWRAQHSISIECWTQASVEFHTFTLSCALMAHLNVRISFVSEVLSEILTFNHSILIEWESVYTVRKPNSIKIEFVPPLTPHSWFHRTVPMSEVSMWQELSKKKTKESSSCHVETLTMERFLRNRVSVSGGACD